MSEFTYDITASIEPAKASPGERINVSVKISNLQGEIRTVYAMVNAYGYSQILPKTEDGIYSARTVVPYQAPTGIVNVVFFAKDQDGNKGPETNFRFQIS